MSGEDRPPAAHLPDAAVRNEVGGVVLGDVVQAGRIELHQAPDPPPPIPRQLPADTAHFTGRAAALEALDDLLAAEVDGATAAVISAISGTAGIGKTALALHWAHGVAGRFPDGHLYLNLRGYDPDPPMQPREALGQLLRALGVSGQKIPTAVDEQAALYRSLLADRRMLLILDNAGTADQVRPLLPGSPGCVAVITSRDSLAGLVAFNAIRRIELGVLTVDEGRELLRRVVGAARTGREPLACDRLLQLCEHLPLAIRIAAERLLASPQLTLEAAADELTSQRLDMLSYETDQRTSLRAVFSWSYQALPPAPQRLFRLLGIHPGRAVSEEAAGALLNQPHSQTRKLLQVLTSAHLLEEPLPRRYRLHDLLRLYAMELAEAEETDTTRRAASRRVFEWYLHTADQADRVLNPHRRRLDLDLRSPVREPKLFADWTEALAWCELERVNLVSATRAAAVRGMHALAWQIPLASWSFFRLRSHWSDWIGSFTIALSACQQAGDRYAEAWVRSNLGIGYKQLGDHENALAQFTEAINLRRALGDGYGEGQTLHHLGALLEVLGRQDEALGCYRRSLALHRASRNRYCEATTLNNIGQFLHRQGDAGSALEHYRQALRIHEEIGYRYGQAETLHDLGRVYEENGRVDLATDSYTRALRLRQEIGHRLGVAETLDRLGMSYAAAGQVSRARAAWSEAHAIFDRIGDPRGEGLRARLESLPPG